MKHHFCDDAGGHAAVHAGLPWGSRLELTTTKRLPGISFPSFNSAACVEATKTTLDCKSLCRSSCWKSSIESLDDNFALQLEQDYVKVLGTYDAIQLGVVLLKVDMLQALSINVDYVDADGDWFLIFSNNY